MNRAKQYVLSKCERQLWDAFHKTAKQFVDWCLKQFAFDVYIGNVEGFSGTRERKNVRAANKLKDSRIGHLGK